MQHAEQLSFFSVLVPSDARYKAVAAISDDGFQQEFCLPSDVPQTVQRTLDTHHNAYLSLCDYQQPRRAGEFVFGFTAFGFDIDCHDSLQPFDDALYTYECMKNTIFESQWFPRPHLVQHTGRGLLVIVAFQRAPKQVLSLWLRMGEGWAAHIRQHLPSCAKLDSTYHDVARVVRVPQSYNSYVAKRSYLLEENNSPVYPLSVLRDKYFPELIPSSKPNRTQLKKSKLPQTGNLFYTDFHIKLHVDRLGDLVQLVELREGRMDGLREITLFLYRYWTCFYMAPESALQAALQLNRTFTTPLPQTEVTSSTRSAETAFQKWKVDKQTGYNYRNTTLIKLLHITEEEQRQLKTIIYKEEKARRRAEKGQWGNQRRDQKRIDTQTKRKQEIANMIAMGMSRKQICRVLGCGHDSVTLVRRMVRDGII